jgi:serine/threonine protein kinase
MWFTQKNILINEHGHVQLIDFGLSGFTDATNPNSLRGGAAGYIAPEKLCPDDTSPRGRTHQFASDIFSFAFICNFVRIVFLSASQLLLRLIIVAVT